MKKAAKENPAAVRDKASAGKQNSAPKDFRFSPVTGDRTPLKKTLPLCLAAFALVVLAGVIAAAVNGVWPFGEESAAAGDLTAEYLPFLYELWDKLHAGGSLLYSWRSPLGAPFWGSLFYYLSSPFNVLLLFVKKTQIFNLTMILMLLRQALAAFTTTLFLTRRRRGGLSPLALGCGVLYALCGWSIAYHTNIIWLDVFFLLPLLALGIEAVIDRADAKLYFAVLTVMLFSNFYLAFFACLFAVLYWLYYFMTEYRVSETVKSGKKLFRTPFFKTRFFRTGALFAGSSVLSALLLGVVFVPLAIQLLHSGADQNAAPKAQLFANLGEQLAAMLSGSRQNGVEYADYPNLYTGILPLAVLPLMLFNKRFSVREKALKCGVIVFFSLSFNVRFLDYFWHGFRYPNGFPFRESFLFSFFLLLFAYETLRNMEKPPVKAVTVSCALFAVLVLGALLYRSSAGDDGIVSIADCAVSALLFALFSVWLFVLQPKRNRVSVLCAWIAAALCFGDAAYTLASGPQLSAFTHAEYAQLYEGASSLTQKDAETDFFRASYESDIINIGSYAGFSGTTQSGSVIPKTTLHFLRNMGLDTNDANFVFTNRPMPVFNSLFGVKYLLEDTDEAAYNTCETVYHAEGKTNGISRSKFDYALPLGFVGNAELEQWNLDDGYAPWNLNGFFCSAGGFGETVDRFDFSELYPASDAVQIEMDMWGSVEFSVDDPSGGATVPLAKVEAEAPVSGPVYLYLNINCEKFPFAMAYCELPDGTEKPILAAGSTVYTYIGDADEGEQITVYLYTAPQAKGSLYYGLYAADNDELRDGYNAIMENGDFTLTDLGDTRLTADVTVCGDGKILCLTVPYDKGWTVTADGETVPEEEIVKVGGALIGLHLGEGAHTVELRYSLPGLLPGTAASLLGAAALAAWLLLRKKKKADLSDESPTDR